MKRIVILVTLLTVSYLVTDRQRLLAAFFMQPADTSVTTLNTVRAVPPATNSPSTQGPTQQDRALADLLRQLTNRSSEGLVEVKRPDGGFQLDLKGRFQNVALARLDVQGGPFVGCVDSLDGANAFFGRNLETGEPLPVSPSPRNETARQAAQVGMPEREYRFYLDLIEEAAQRRKLAPNSATITISNGDGAGEGFNDPTPKAAEGGNNGATLGAQRLNLFNFAASIWGAFLDSNVSTVVNAQFNPLTPCSTSGGVLGSAGSTTVFRDFSGAVFTGTWYHSALANKLSGANLDAGADINATFNSDVDTGCLGAGTRFYYGFDNSTPANTVNLLVVLLHEFGHGLGFSSFVNGTTGALLLGFPDVYTRFMFDRDVNLYWNQMSNAQRQTSALNTNDVLWDGAHVRIASGFLTNGRDAATGRVELFTPNPLQGGSSISHFSTAAFPNLLMEPSINAGLPLDLDLTRQQMRDVGWYRDTTADLTADTITNVMPNSGSFTVGNMTNVTWTNNGGFNRNVTIELSTDGGTTFPLALATDVSNTGTRSITIPNNPTTQARVRVREHNFVAPLGTSSANFTIMGSNTAPTISAVGVNRQQGSPVANSTIANVNDPDQTEDTLTVTVNGGANATVNGVTVSGISVSAAGVVSANVIAACGATNANFTLTVTDNMAASNNATLSVTVSANSAPVLTYNNQAVAAGGALNINPATGPSDNGSVSTIVVQSQGTYTGTISVNNGTGVISLNNAKPGGMHTITIRATDDCGATTDAMFTLTVNCPTLTVNPATLPNGTVGTGYNQTITASGCTAPYAFSVSAGTLPTGLTLAAGGGLTGTPSVANTFNFTVLATDANGCTGTQAYAVTINPANNPPTISAVAVNRQQGSPVANSNIANVNDLDQTEETLTVTVNSGASATVNGVTVSGLSVSAAGVVTANVIAGCTATTATFTLTVTDNAAASNNATLTVTVTGNSAPVFGYASPQGVAAGGSLTVNPSAGPSDNGSVAALVLQSQGTYTGTISVNNSTGVVSISNATPVGSHTIVIRATDNCGATTDGTFTLNVNNNLPTITAGGPLARQQGSAGTVATIATVNDTETPRANLTVTVMSAPAGISLTSISAPNATTGEVTATVAAGCTATTGANTVVLKVTDGNSGTAMANLTVNVSANSAPVLTYNNQAVAAGGALNINPATGPSDNGSVSSIVVQSQGTYTGTISVNNGTGIVSISNAKPGGMHMITIRATDNCGVTTDATFTLTVNCPTISLSPPTLPNGTVGAGYNQTITANGGTAPYTFSVSAGTLPTGLNLSASGALSGTPSVVNTFNFTVLATDANGCMGALAYALTINAANILPTINAVAVSRQQGSPVSNSTIANVTDADQALNTLGVTVNGGASATVNGITVSGLSVNAAGVVTANVIAGCTATAANFTLTVTDAASATANATLTVTVTANSTPVLTYANQAVVGGGALNINPASGPSDNGSVSSIVVQSQSTYTGTISVNNGTGVVALSNAAPVGVHTLTIRATDNCGVVTDAVFTLTVNNNLPTITAAAPLARQQGSAGTVSTIATVNDTETAAGSLTVVATTVPAGLTVTGITNTNGTITANVAALCNATLGSNTVVLTVTDGHSGTATANLTVNVTANGAPVLTYNNQAVAAGGSLNVNPATGPSDNGTVSNIVVQSQSTYTGTITVNNSTGVVAISNAAPGGTHTLTIRATDNCGATTDAAFTLTVNCPTISLSPTTLPNGMAGVGYNQTLTASGGTAPYTFSLNGGALPGGLSLSSGGVLSGTPAAFGTFNFTAQATDANGCMGTQAYTLLINPPCATLTINPASAANGFVGTAYAQTFTQTGGSGTITWSSTGTLPGGLTLNAASGVLSGTPTANGTFNATIRATDANGCFGERSYTVLISGAGLQFYPLPSPVRLLDTRNGATACNQPNAPITGGTSLTQPGRSTCTIPANAVALTGNVTTVNSGGGFLTLYPSDAAQPTVASTNYVANEIINNVFTVGLGADGAFKIFAFNTTEVVVDVSGYYAPPATGGLFFHPLPKPIRLLETRAGQVGCNTPGVPISGGDAGTLTQLARLTCDGVTIPNAALAIVGNATTVNPQGGGFLTLFPADAQKPLAASSNYNPGQIVNGPFSVGLSPTGQFKIFTFATTDLVVDVLGYYSTEATDANGAGLLFSPLAHPVRLLETRVGQAVGCFKPGAPLNGNQEYTQVARGLCDGVTVPANALGVVGNATVVGPTGNGFLTLWPSAAASRPLVATANYNLGAVVNRHFIVGLGQADGAFKIYSFATTNLVVDLSGYFAP